MKLLLEYFDIRKLTVSLDGDDVASFVAMGFKQREVPLPEGGMGIELRYIVNSPERFEHVITCRPFSGGDGHVVVEQIPNDITVNENVYMYSFEPLTMQSWKTMNVAAKDEMESELKSDTDLKNYYWNDWVPEYWTEDFQPWT